MRPIYDDHATTWDEYCGEGSRLFRVFANPNDVVVLYEWNIKENTEEFFELSGLREKMVETGAVGGSEGSPLTRSRPRPKNWSPNSHALG